MKIYLITSNPAISGAMSSQLEKLGDVVIINGEKLKKEEVLSKAKDVEILIGGPSGIDNLSRKLLSELKNLKLVATLTVNTAWIDMQAAKELGITICNIKGANAESVAEHAWGMILDLSKRITEFDRDVRNKGAFKFADYIGKEVHGKTIGIIGLGDIGKKIARIAQGFEMKILGHNQSGHPVQGIELVSIEELLTESNIVVTCVPLTKETTAMISEKELALMKRGSILINPAMEAVTDKDAVLKALHEGKLFGFGIETDIMTPIAPDDPYLKHPRIIVTPHNAFNTEDANRKSYELAISNVAAFIAGKPQNVVV